MDKNNKVIKQMLFQKLMEENALWSYNIERNNPENINDEILIVKTLTHLDLAEIDLLFTIYPFYKIKKIWREQMAVSTEYNYTLNKFLAWKYFNVKEPKKYLRTLESKHIKEISR